MHAFNVDPKIAAVELGATFLSRLAYPSRKQQYEEFAGALICGAVDVLLADAALRATVPEALRLACRVRDRSRTARCLESGSIILSRERLPAAKMAGPRVHAFMSDRDGSQRPRTVPDYASIEMLTAISVDLDDPSRPADKRGRKPYGGRGNAELNQSNIKERQWKRSLPVLHMAMALEIELSNNGSDQRPDFGAIIFYEDICNRMCCNAEKLRPVVAEIYRLREKQFAFWLTDSTSESPAF